VSHNEVRKTGKGSRNIEEERNSVSKGNRGKGLWDILFWERFEGGKKETVMA